MRRDDADPDHIEGREQRPLFWPGYQSAQVSRVSKLWGMTMLTRLSTPRVDVRFEHGIFVDSQMRACTMDLAQSDLEKMGLPVQY